MWLSLGLLACGETEGDVCPVHQRYDPAGSNVVEMWPDPLLTADADTPTGIALDADAESSYLAWGGVTYRIALGPHQGQKVFTLKTLPACDPDNPLVDTVGKTSGFSLHAGVGTKARERDTLERLCRYITRPAVSEKRLSLTAHGKVRPQLKTPYRDGTTHVIFEPLDIIVRLAALVS
jgi:hypothetical protein